MSSVIETYDLTLYGCPMHYIKAREILRPMMLEDVILFEVNNGDAVEEVINSLRHDGQSCVVESVEGPTTLIRVVKSV